MTVSGFPSDFLSLSEKKKPEFHLAYQKAISLDGAALFSINHRERMQKFKELRVTAMGYESSSQFQDSKKENTAQLVINYSVPDPIPTMVSRILGQQVAKEAEIRLEPNDPLSVSELSKRKDRLINIMTLSKMRDAIIEEFGIDPLAEISEKEIYTSEEEIDLHISVNEKSSIAIAFEQAVDHIIDANTKQELEMQLRKDLIVCNVAVAMSKLDNMGNVVIEYVDVAEWGTSYCRKNDFSDAKYHFVNRYITLEQLAAESNLSDEKLKKIARQAMGKSWQRTWDNTNYFIWDAPYRNFLVRVVYAEYLSLDKMWYRKKPTRKGNGYFLEPVDEKKVKKDGDYIQKEFGAVYTSNWVFDTDHVYNYTKKHNCIVEFDGVNYLDKAEFSFRSYCPEMYDMRTKSLVEKMIEPADKIKLVGAKMAHLISKMRPPGVAIDLYALQNALGGLGEKAMTQDEQQALFDEVGTLYYSSMGQGGRQLQNQNPIREIPMSLQSQLSDLITTHNMQMRILEEVTGAYSQNLSTSSSKEELVGLQKMAIASQQNALRFLDRAYENIMVRMAADVCRYVAMAISDGISPKKYGIALGNSAVEIIKMTEKIPIKQLGITIRVSSDIEELTWFDRYVEAEMNKGLIDSGIASTARLLAKRNIQYGAQYLATMVRKEKKRISEQEMARIQETSKGNLEVAMMSEEMKNKSYTHKTDEDIRKLKAEYLLKFDLAKVEHEGDVVEIETKGDKEIEKVEIASELALQAGKLNEGSEKIQGSIPKELGVRQPKM